MGITCTVVINSKHCQVKAFLSELIAFIWAQALRGHFSSNYDKVKPRNKVIVIFKNISREINDNW